MSEKTYPLIIEPSILELLGPSRYSNIYHVLEGFIINTSQIAYVDNFSNDGLRGL